MYLFSFDFFEFKIFLAVFGFLSGLCCDIITLFSHPNNFHFAFILYPLMFVGFAFFLEMWFKLTTLILDKIRERRIRRWHAMLGGLQ